MRSAWGPAAAVGLAVVGVSIAVEVATNPAVQHEIGEAVTEVKQTVSEIGTTITSTAKGIWDGIVNATKDKPQREKDIGDFKKNRPSHPDYVPPKNWNGTKVKNPNGRGSGWPAKNGDVWVPENHGGTHAPHWDVQHPNGTHTPIYPK